MPSQTSLFSTLMHMVYDPELQAPLHFEVGSGNLNDITFAKQRLKIEPGASYVFDLGYYDFGFWAELAFAL